MKKIKVWVNSQDGYWETDFNSPKGVKTFLVTQKEIMKNNEAISTQILLDGSESK